MPTFAQFELIEPVSDDVANTWLAREPGSGRMLLLHKFSRASGLREKIRTMNPPDLGMLIKFGEESGLFYVVTYDTPELRQFRQWVESRSKVKSASTYPPGVEHSDPMKTGLWRSKATPSSEPGTFTRMFEAQPPAVEPNPQPAASGPGEFTRMFQTPAAAEPNPPAAPKQDAERTRTIEIPAWTEPAAAPASTPGAGEFTGAFQQPPAPEQDLPAALNGPSGKAEPGTFTRMFQAPVEPAAPAREIPSPQPAASAPKTQNERSEFTRMFAAHPAEPPASETPPIPPSPKPSGGAEPGTFTRMFQAPSEPRPIEPRPPAPAPPTANSPGEFTQMFSAPPAPPPTSRPVPAPPQPSASGGDFTGFFGRSMPSTPLGDNLDRTPSIPPEPAPRDPGGFTRMFGAAEPLRGQAPGQSAPPPPATGLFHSPQPAAPSPAAPSGPGEYTRLFSAPAPAQTFALPAPAPAPSAPPASAASSSTPEPKPLKAAAAQKPSNYIALIIVLALLAVLAIGLIFYFTLRR